MQRKAATHQSRAANVQSAFERLPKSCENSFYAATEVGPDGAIYQGTWYGATRYGAR